MVSPGQVAVSCQWPVYTKSKTRPIWVVTQDEPTGCFWSEEVLVGWQLAPVADITFVVRLANERTQCVAELELQSRSYPSPSSLKGLGSPLAVRHFTSLSGVL